VDSITDMAAHAEAGGVEEAGLAASGAAVVMFGCAAAEGAESGAGAVVADENAGGGTA